MNAEMNERATTEANFLESDKFKAYKKNSKCNKCKKLDHFARECKVSKHILEDEEEIAH